MHTGNGGLVIEASDVGLGMTEADLRVANTRLQSGGEVNPYTARHMGLFVVGRLAAQHGLVVRLRSTIAQDPNSGTTAGLPPGRTAAPGFGSAPGRGAGLRRPGLRRGRASRPRRRSTRGTRSTPRSSGTLRRPFPSTAMATRTFRSPFCRNATRGPAASPVFRRCHSSLPRARFGLARGRVAGGFDAGADAVSRPDAGSPAAEFRPDEHVGILRWAGPGGRPAIQRGLPGRHHRRRPRPRSPNRQAPRRRRRAATMRSSRRCCPSG